MKLSNKILLGGFLSIIGVAILFVGFMSLRPGRKDVSSLDFEWDSSEKEYNLIEGVDSDFSNINISGAWEVEVKAGSKYEAKFSGDEEVFNSLKVSVYNNVLDIIHDEEIKVKMNAPKARLVIVLPNLESIDFKGAGDILIKGFNNKSLEVNIEGLINVVSKNCGFKDLSLDLEGMGNVDFSDCELEDVFIKSALMGNLEFGVKNAKISGNVEGMGSVKFIGPVKENNLKTEGMVDLKLR